VQNVKKERWILLFPTVEVFSGLAKYAQFSAELNSLGAELE